ncbi:lactate utilization protein [uncultured Sphaerochaeta sp.]|uniref:lactate utilization protein n=1 Tax=uncultured Sphaerochaeta sp. TaxID=886478 RepID=UPI002A0A2476|nr:lactate utilization protein [uncultured Sphaerochaeta sp.]
MDANVKTNRTLQVERTIKALKKNNIDARFLETIDDVIPSVTSLLTKGESVAVGGSVTLNETGILDLLRNGDYTFYDRYKPGLDKEGITEVMHNSFFVDTYLASANAVTEHGELYCVDGTSNRVAALLYGPKQVILVVSWDKIVPDLVSAILRVKQLAAPANARRLNTGAYCVESGKCINAHCDANNLMALTAGACEHTICSNYVVFSHQQIEGRMKVLIIGESLGY